MAAPLPPKPDHPTKPDSPQPEQPPVTSSPRAVHRALLWPALAVVLGALLIHNELQGPTGLKPPIRPVAVAPAAPRATGTTAVPLAALPRSAPKRISIPEIGVNAPFTELTIGPSGQLNVPPADDTNLVGWFSGGASPGESGASIVVGHVDTNTGPAVFAGLPTLKPGSAVSITRADGMVVTFKVDSVSTFDKAKFPNERVYADPPSPQLRLITCGGEYDREKGDYEANVVVFAHLESARRA